jgi:sarcosine oxidase delta subunit
LAFSIWFSWASPVPRKINPKPKIRKKKDFLMRSPPGSLDSTWHHYKGAFLRLSTQTMGSKIADRIHASQEMAPTSGDARYSDSRPFDNF